jgi:hypothetical protein
MKTNIYTKPAERPAPIRIDRRPAKSASDWKPEPCPLSREELRRIIIRQIG